jgi:hypothetical protein
MFDAEGRAPDIRVEHLFPLFGSGVNVSDDECGSIIDQNIQFAEGRNSFRN